MAFTDQSFAIFLPTVFVLYWIVRRKTAQNLVLLSASYLFYGFIHPWFCLLLATSTVVDYFGALLLHGPSRGPAFRKTVLGLSLAANLGMLGVFKYYNFFTANAGELLETLGIRVEPVLLAVVLPVGISFYTFQSMSYTIDVYRGQMRARRNFVDFAVFVSCFPQLVAGPIERAARLLPQIEAPRRWSWPTFFSAFPLLILGFFKKLVVADNLCGLVEQVYMLEHPSLFVLGAGTAAFALQILADFSAYTDIARGSARLLGIDLMKNFDAPYLAVSPSDFWRRWHISLSTWIRDYVYIPLGGSKVDSRWRHVWILIVTFGLAGLWHGAEWHFVVWGLFHAVLLAIYHQLGMGGRWRPEGVLRLGAGWAVMMLLTLVGWTLFRATSLSWLAGAVGHAGVGLSGDDLFAGALILGYCVAYGFPWLLYAALQKLWAGLYWHRLVCHWAMLGLIILLANRDPEAFIYFQF